MYTIAAVTGYQALIESKHLPYWMGGHGDSKTAFESTMLNAPFCESSRSLYVWFLCMFGIYFGELVTHVFIEEHKKDFDEMLIHHLATCLAVFGSFYSGAVGIGAIISWIHCSSDIFIGLVKIAASTHYNETTVVIYFMMLSAWIFFRLMCLPFIIYSLATSHMAVFPDPLSEFNFY